MPGLVPGIHVLGLECKDVDARVKPAHDEEVALQPFRSRMRLP